MMQVVPMLHLGIASHPEMFHTRDTVWKKIVAEGHDGVCRHGRDTVLCMLHRRNDRSVLWLVRRGAGDRWDIRAECDGS